MRISWAEGGGAGAPASRQESSLLGLARAHPDAALALGALLLALFSTAWMLLQSPDFFSGYDYVRMHAFYKAYLRDALLAGRLPLWNPYSGLGRPFLADIEAQALYPPNLLVVPFGVRAGVALSVFLHQALAIACGSRLGRILGAGPLQGFLLGAGLALSSPFAARLATGMVPVYCSLCWWPALLWLGARLQDRWSRGAAGGFAACVAMAILAGNPPILFVEALGLVVFLVFRLEAAGGWRRTLANHAGLALAAALGAGVACVQLLPFLELVGQGNRPLHSAAFAVANGMPPASWLSLAFPTTAAFGPNWEYDLYCGLVPLMAAAGALLLWRERAVRALLGLGLCGALLAVGDRAPFLAWVVHVVPGAGALRLPSRYGIWVATSVLGLASVALSRPGARAIPAAACVLAVAAGCAVWLKPYAAGVRADAAAYYGPRLGALGAAALATCLWHARARWPRAARPAGLALGAFCLGDWLWAAHLQAPAYSAYGFSTREADVRSELSARGLLAPGQPPPRIAFDPADLCENAGMAIGFSAASSYCNPALARVWGFVHAAAGARPSAEDFIRLPAAVGQEPDRLGAMSLAGVLGRSGRGLAWRSGADPRAYVAFDAEIAPDWVAAERAMAAGGDFHKKAILEAGSDPGFRPSGPGGPAQARIERFEPERVSVRVQAPAAGILILAEAWYPGWGATVGGRPQPVFPVNGWMRGVLVPPGASEVVFSYRSRYLAGGAAVSLACAALLLALVLGAPRSARAQTDSSSL